MPGFDVDPETMRRSADELDAATAEVQALLDKFTGAVEQFADAFGGDTIGSLGGVGHQLCMDALTESFTADIEDLTGLAQAVRDMADDHQGADDEIGEAFKLLNRSIGKS
ncbi:WXG100 family type VII secretion target [Glycomyces buryatensis]|uniref:WXG100 family type VII secretion target n=1 Tax=Glycomyces buryatensis TaxID=2570927 RepID=A0A4S8QBF9_9ACTN|nr:hypothetical protein [Glycomyces buryatensis]THV37754.1 hypothetical protein FAB82_20130 [Glycomyces buryatensis]